MLFPPHSVDGSPQLTLELDDRGDLLPRILWAGVTTPPTTMSSPSWSSAWSLAE